MKIRWRAEGQREGKQRTGWGESGAGGAGNGWNRDESRRRAIERVEKRKKRERKEAEERKGEAARQSASHSFILSQSDGDIDRCNATFPLVSRPSTTHSRSRATGSLFSRECDYRTPWKSITLYQFFLKGLPTGDGPSETQHPRDPRSTTHDRPPPLFGDDPLSTEFLSTDSIFRTSLPADKLFKRSMDL